MYKQKKYIILLLVLFSFSCSSFAKTDDIIYLIPKGYTGGVIILYSKTDGIVPETKEDGTIIYRIPKDGFLTVKRPSKPGPYKFSYYFVNDKDQRTEIEYVYPKYYVRDRGDTTSKSMDTLTEDELNTKIFAMHHRNITFDMNGDRVILNAFSVGYPKDSTSLYTKTLDRVDEIEKDIANGKIKP